MKRICIFCGKEDLTQEHILPKWIQKYFQPSSVDLNVVQKSDGKTYEFKEKAFNHTAKIVCKECNSGWMSDLENEVQGLLGPMFNGSNPSTILSTYERSLIAHWAAKTFAILEFSSNEHVSHMPRSVPTSLYSTRTLSQEHTIYMGYRQDAYGLTGNHIAGFQAQTPTKIKVKPMHRKRLEAAYLKSLKFFSSSLVIGHVYFYIVGSNIPDSYTFLYPYQTEYLNQIWPESSTDRYNWPNTKPIEILGKWEGANDFFNGLVSADFYK